MVADTAASQIGIRRGKTPIPWQPHKILEETMAGVFAAFGAILFVGLLWDVSAAAVFLLVDLVTEHPIKLQII